MRLRPRVREPPSTTGSAPVTKPASSLTRNATAEASSSTWARWPNGARRVVYGRMTVIPVGLPWSSSISAADASANPISRLTNASGRTTPDRTSSSKAG